MIAEQFQVLNDPCGDTRNAHGPFRCDSVASNYRIEILRAVRYRATIFPYRLEPTGPDFSSSVFHRGGRFLDLTPEITLARFLLCRSRRIETFREVIARFRKRNYARLILRAYFGEPILSMHSLITARVPYTSSSTWISKLLELRTMIPSYLTSAPELNRNC